MGTCLLEAAAILSRVGRGSDVALYLVVALVLRDTVMRWPSSSSSSPQGPGSFWWVGPVLLGASMAVPLASGARRFPALAAIICVPPLAHVAFAASRRKLALLFEPFGGGPLFSVLQACGWTLYGCLCIDVTCLARCALLPDSRLASTFGLSQPCLLGSLGAAAHLALLFSLAVRADAARPVATASDCAVVASALTGAAGLGVALCLDVDPDETAAVFAAFLGLPSVPRLLPVSVALAAAALVPLHVALGAPGPTPRLAKLLWLLGLLADWGDTSLLLPRALLLSLSLLLVLRRRLPPPRVPPLPPDPNHLCFLIAQLPRTASTSSIPPDRPWAPPLTFAVAEFLLGPKPPLRSQRPPAAARPSIVPPPPRPPRHRLPPPVPS